MRDVERHARPDEHTRPVLVDRLRLCHPGRSGPVNVSLAWRYKRPAGKQSTTRTSSASTAAARTARARSRLAPSSAATTTLARPTRLSAGSQTISVTVGLAGSLDLSDTASRQVAAHRRQPDERGRLRRTWRGRVQRARSSAAARRRTSSTGRAICPDPSPPAGPAACVDAEDRHAAGPTEKALDDALRELPCRQLARTTTPRTNRES